MLTPTDPTISIAPTSPSSSPSTEDIRFLKEAIKEAAQGLAEGGIPIGAAIVEFTPEGQRILGTGRNKRVQLNSAIRHGETDCLENIGRLPASVLKNCVMYTTLSPCSMCAGAMILYGFTKVVIGENKTFVGAEQTLRLHGVEIVNLDNQECKDLMDTFITNHPDIWNEDVGQE